MASSSNKEQLDTAAKLAALMDRMADASNKINDAQVLQVDTMRQLVAAMSEMKTDESQAQINAVGTSIKGLVDKMNELGKTNQQTLEQLGKQALNAGESMSTLAQKANTTQISLDNVNKTKLDRLLGALEETGGTTKLLFSQMNKLGTYMSKRFPRAWVIAGAAVTGFYQGMKNVMAVGEGLLGFLGGIASSLLNVGASILAIPFKMFKGIVDIANEAAGGSNALMQAIENLRKEFGALSGTSPKTIMSMSVNLKGFSDTGLDAWRVFGDLTKRLEDFLKLAQEMGPTFQSFSDEFRENGGAILAWQKGLGLSGEMMKTIGERSKTFGTTLAKQLYEVQKQAQDLGLAFKIDSKLISRDMAKAFADVKHFAGATVKEIASASVYARKLGLELEKITGTLDAFETFDTAAENASKLSQAFGMNIDAFKMMEAQDPATQIEMLRKQFKMAGQDASGFNRQQMKLLASSTGLDEATARQVFSMKNAGVSLDDIKKKSDAAEKKQMSQAEAMAKLADAIERLVMAGTVIKGGFFDRFFHGFLGGVQASKEFYGIIFNINRAMLMTERAGVRLGKAFVQLFPGVKDILGGIKDFFDPSKFGEVFNAITDELIKFFEGFTKGNYSFKQLMENLQKTFFRFFNKSEGPGKQMLKGFGEFFDVMSKIVSAGIRWISDKVHDTIIWITDIITGKTSISMPSANGGLGFLAQLLLPILDALKYAGKTIGPVLWDLVQELGDKLWSFLTSEKVLAKLRPFGLVLGTVLFGPVASRGLLAGIAAGFGKGFIGGVGSIIKKFIPEVSKNVAEVAATASKAPSMPDVSKDGLFAPISSKAAEATAGAGKAMDDGSSKFSIRKVLTFLVAVAGIMVIGMVAIFSAIYIIRKFKIKPLELMMALGAVAGMALAMLPIAGALALISKFKIDPTAAAIGIAAIAVAIAVMALTLGGVYLLLHNLKIAELNAITSIMVDMAKVFVLAGVVVLASMGIGLIISSTSGVAGGMAAAGMALLVTAVGVMTTTAIGIMQKLNDMPMGTGFKDKIEAFSKIMDAITNFAKNLTEMLKAVQPSLLTILRGGDDTNQRITKLNEFLNSFIGGLITLIDKIIWAIKEMTHGDDRIIKAAEVFADILHAVGSLATSMQISPELYKMASGLFKSSDTAGDAIRETANYVVTMGSTLTVLIDKVQHFVADVAKMNLTEDQIKRVAVVVSLFPHIAAMAGMLKIDPAVVNAINDGFGDPQVMSQLSSQIITLGGQIREVINSVTTLVPAITKAMQGLNNSQIEGMKVFQPMLASVFGLVISIMGVIQGVMLSRTLEDSTGQIASIGMRKKLLNQMIGTITGIMIGMSVQLPTLINALKTGLDGINIGDAKSMSTYKTKIELIKVTMDTASLIINAFKGGKNEAGVILKNAETYVSRISEMIFYINMIDGKGTPGIPQLATAIAGIDIKGINVKTIDDVKKVIDAAVNITGALVRIPAITGEQGLAIADFVKNIKNNGLITALTCVGALVNEANKLNDALKLPDIKLDAKLNALASGLGIGGKYNYTVKSRNVEIYVTFNVEMNAADLEKSLVLREKSIIRDRLNFATSRGQGKQTTDELPNKISSPVINPAVAK